MDESLFLGNVPVNQPLKNKRSRKKKVKQRLYWSARIGSDLAPRFGVSSGS